MSYWKTHEYHRLSVKDYVEEFAGWTPIKELVCYAGSERDRAFISALFCTGGRASEVLSLSTDSFSLIKDQNLLVVRNMKLVKRYKKLTETVDAEGHRHWTTEKKLATRKPYPIFLNEPIAKLFYEYVSKNVGPLFPSTYKKGFPLSRFWAYKLIRQIDTTLPKDLKERLGLNRPFMDNEKKLSDTIHLWLHWFRSQRASQLVFDYGYELLDLIDYFSWERHETALIYARKGWRGLASKMQNVKIQYD